VNDNCASQLRESGITALHGLFVSDWLRSFQEAAARCFAAVEADNAVAGRHSFNRFSHSVPLIALTSFGCEDMLAPMYADGLEALLSNAIGGPWACNLEHSWVRKKFAPMLAPTVFAYVEQGWHQDGALGVQFPREPGAALSMTELLTCWIPLDACGLDSPGLEFVRGRQPALLHFTELEDAALRQRFAPQDFWAPELELGDGLVFLNSVLHRTYTRPEMLRNRLSIEYRIFPRSRPG